MFQAEQGQSFEVKGPLTCVSDRWQLGPGSQGGGRGKGRGKGGEEEREGL